MLMLLAGAQLRTAIVAGSGCEFDYDGRRLGIGGGLTAAAMATFNHFDALPSIFFFFAVASLASSLLCHLLPAPEVRMSTSAADPANS